MLTKSLAYRIYWAGRYLERIENICRISVIALNNGISLDSIAKEYGLKDEKELFEYIRMSLEQLRENIRSFASERMMIEVNEMELRINSPKDNLISYFNNIISSAMSLGNGLEEYFNERMYNLRVRSQQENQPEPK
ncbi:alpha-E domain-containing protein [Sulfuracidifex metallicus]|uniref:alpha-E domain-containing protein n=1 Tax=Sulfuracidifex metallicus TaxID=47303 RepID=UPI00227691C9|nr:alpha-E domain-containing protein [Sulfuracidifex metallicus]MCY0849744.1 alpha-E domain-containing protein [Sulfuracidifex metallicus]